MSTSFKPWGRPQLDLQLEDVFHFAVSSWSSFFVKALFLHQMEKWGPVCVQFPCSLYKPAEVIPLKHQRVHTSLRLLHLLLSQRHLYIPHLLRVSSLKFHKLAFCKHSLILKLIEWVVCLKIFRNALMKWWHFSTPPTTMFKCDSRPWRIS